MGFSISSWVQQTGILKVTSTSQPTAPDSRRHKDAIFVEGERLYLAVLGVSILLAIFLWMCLAWLLSLYQEFKDVPVEPQWCIVVKKRLI